MSKSAERLERHKKSEGSDSVNFVECNSNYSVINFYNDESKEDTVGGIVFRQGQNKLQHRTHY